MKLLCTTIIYKDESLFAYYVIQQKKRGKLFADWHDAKWILDDLSHSRLPEVEKEMRVLINNDNKNTNILKYSKI